MDKITGAAGPHSMVFWLKIEIQERKINGQLSGVPKEPKDYRGVIHCKDKEEAIFIRTHIIENLTKDLKECQVKLETEKVSAPSDTENPREV